jgi:phosphoribosylglycinamide formyltransferase-1
MRRILVLASGSGTLAESIFTADFSAEAAEVVALISDRPEARVLQRATNHHIESYVIPMTEDRTHWNLELEKLIAALRPDLVVSAGFMRILPEAITTRFKIINSHPALLPLFPGAHAVRDALAAGARKSGTTIHWVDAGVDTGEVIAQAELDIAPGDNEESLHERIKILERSLIVATIEQLLSTMENGRS